MKLPGTRDNFSMSFLYAGKEKKVPVILDAYSNGSLDLTEVNTILELYNVKLFVEEKGCEAGWSDDELTEYQLLVKGIMDSVRSFFDSLNMENIVSTHEDCEVVYWPDFWAFFYMFKAYERIPKESFADTIEKLHVSPEELLSNKEFVRFFDIEIAELLRTPDYGAEFIVDYYMRREKGKDLYWPRSMSQIDRNHTVSLYVNSGEANPNVLRLIFEGKSRDSSAFEPDVKMRFQAKKEYEEFWKKRKGIVQSISSDSVSFLPEGPEVGIVVTKDNIQVTHNTKWIEGNLDNLTLLNNFIYLFGYTDTWGRCWLTTEALDKSPADRFFSIGGYGMYEPGPVFFKMNLLADTQLKMYRDFLGRKGIYIENILKWFFEEYLRDEFLVKGFYCVMPKAEDSVLSKYNRIAAVIDGVKKQFKLYREEGYIDRQFYEMIKQVPKYSALPSMIKNKYAYACSKDLDREMTDFFSNQSPLVLYEDKPGGIKCFYDLIDRGEVSKTDIYEFNIQEIEWLVSREALVFSGGIIKPNYDRARILRELYNSKVICLQYIKSEILRELIQKGEVVSESTLLSKPEARYFDYVLDDFFSDGLGLRNKYIHDSIPLDEQKQDEDYNVLLKMLIILVIKINEDFCLRDRLSNSSDFYET